MWQLREGIYDNEYLDCCSGCVTLASLAGCCLKTPETLGIERPPRAKRRW